ncbi:helix-turn-helix transcriptional regulator [Ensifer sp. Root31]|uniref:helix-turn-helix domain-containing protein n=1 Tax=Ensifer sp. Root31 TaxID=1736512 RepID=UPI0009EC9134|nr:helix-turn-helix transcriptional regulator [Ensifer sp. Root31]
MDGLQRIVRNSTLNSDIRRWRCSAMPTRVNTTAALAEELGERLRAVRLDHRFSRDRLAAALGVTLHQVQKYENGKSNISVPMLILMCEALGAHPMELIGTMVEARVTVCKTPDIAQERLVMAQLKLEEICREIAAGT